MPKSKKTEADRIAATTLDEATGRRWIQQLLTGRGEGLRGRFSTLHDAIKERDKAFHSENPPVFLPPFEGMQTFQSDVLRDTHQKFMTRLVEHPIRVQVKPPRDTIPQREGAQKLAVVFETALDLVQEREGISLLGMLGDGQLRHCYGVLHWYKRTDVYPDYPEPVELDDEPADKDEAKHYRKYAEDETPRRKGAKYRETEATLQDRDKRARATAGFSYAVEVLRADQFAYVPDKGCPNGMGLAISMVTVGILDYDMGAQRDGFKLSLYDKSIALKVYEEEPAPERGEPSADEGAWGKRMRVARLWTRDECYEYGAHEDQGEFTLLRSWKHDHRMPPFALAKALELNEPDPLYRFPPFLLGLYRTKPDYDYERSLGRALAEQTAVPRYWVKLAEGSYWLDAHGNKIVLSEDAAAAASLPPGAELVKVDMEVNPAFVAFLEMSGADVERATPSTGDVEVGASTAPHTLSMAQAQANAPVAFLKAQQMLAVRTMLRNIAETESRGRESMVVMAKVADGAPISGTLVEVKPEEIPGLDIDVSINPASGAQEVATAEYYRGLLNDEKVPFTRREYLEKTGHENPDAAIEAWIAEGAEMQAVERVTQQELARRFGDVFVLTPGGGVIDWKGAGTDPLAVLASQGVVPPPPPPEPTAPGGVGDPATAPLAPLGELEPMPQAAGDLAGMVV